MDKVQNMFLTILTILFLVNEIPILTSSLLCLLSCSLDCMFKYKQETVVEHYFNMR